MSFIVKLLTLRIIWRINGVALVFFEVLRFLPPVSSVQYQLLIHLLVPGHAFSSDLNGYRQEGVGWFDMTIKNGKRWSAAEAYLRPALKR